MELLVKNMWRNMKWGKRRLGRHSVVLGEGNGNQMVEIGSCSQSEELNFCLKDEHEGDKERLREVFTPSVTWSEVPSYSTQAFPWHSWVSVTLEFFPPGVAWETEASMNRKREWDCFLEFSSCPGNGYFAEFKRETKLAYEISFRWPINIFVCRESVDQKSNSSSS